MPSAEENPGRHLEHLRWMTREIEVGTGRNPLSAIRFLRESLAGAPPMVVVLRRTQIAEQLEAAGELAAAQEELNGLDLTGIPPVIAARVWLRRASLRRWNADAAQVVHAAQQSLALYQAARDTMGAGAALALLGHGYRLLDDYELARDYLREAADVQAQAGETRVLAQTCWTLATVERHIGSESDAVFAARRGLKALDSAGMSGEADYALRGHLNGVHGDVAFDRGEMAEALKRHELALTDWQATSDARLPALAYRNLAEVYIAVGDWKRAEQFLSQAVYIAAEADSTLHAAVLSSLGRLLSRTGRIEEAERQARYALKMATDQRNPAGEAECLDALAAVLLEARRPAEAIPLLARAADIEQRLRRINRLTATRFILAEAHLMNGDFAEAEKLAVPADGAGNSFLSAWAARLAGQVAFLNGRRDDALLHCARALSSFESLGLAWETAVSHFQTGVVFAALDTTRARHHFTLALGQFEQLAARPRAERAAQALAELDERISGKFSIAPILDEIRVERLAAADTPDGLMRELSALLNEDFRFEAIVFVEKNARVNCLAAHGGAAGVTDHLGRVLEAHVLQNGPLPDGFRRVNSPDESAGRYWMWTTPQAVTDPTLLRATVRVAELCLDRLIAREALRRDAGARRVMDFRFADERFAELGLVCESPAMKTVAARILKIRDSVVSVLISGESGTGKEVIAKTLHRLSARGGKPFVAFNCAAVPSELAESQLFGHRKGAFTGADRESLGVIRAADGGTLFLDEIGELPLPLQPKLLRFLQEREVHPVGAERPVHVDVRVIAATNRDLTAEVAAGRFREDLFYRLNVLQLALPPLRERREDIPVLVQQMLRDLQAQSNKQVNLSEAALDAFVRRDWSGNVRQLRNELERAVALADDGELLLPEHFIDDRSLTPSFPPEKSVAPNAPSPSGYDQTTLAEAVAEVERRMILAALQNFGGNVSRTAAALAVTRTGLRQKCERLGITLKEFRE